MKDEDGNETSVKKEAGVLVIGIAAAAFFGWLFLDAGDVEVLFGPLLELFRG